jgi:hypothetical protein
LQLFDFIGAPKRIKERTFRGGPFSCKGHLDQQLNAMLSRLRAARPGRDEGQRVTFVGRRYSSLFDP